MGWEKCAVHFSNTDNVERLSIEYWCIDWLHQLRFMMEHNQDHSSGIPLPPPSSSWWSQGINYHSHHLPWLGVLPWEQTSSVIRLTTSWCRAAILTGNSRSSNISSIWIIDNNSLSLSPSFTCWACERHLLTGWSVVQPPPGESTAVCRAAVQFPPNTFPSSLPPWPPHSEPQPQLKFRRLRRFLEWFSSQSLTMWLLSFWESGRFKPIYLRCCQR